MSMNQLKVVFLILMMLATGGLVLAIVSINLIASDSSSVESYEPTSAINRVRLAPNIWLIVDEQQGCQYIETSAGITPRMHSNGVHYCIPPDMELTDLNLSLHFNDFEI